MTESDYGTGIMRPPVLNAMLVVLIVGGPIGALAVAISMRPDHSAAITVVTCVGIAVGAWVAAALRVLALQIRDSLRTLVSAADGEH